MNRLLEVFINMNKNSKLAIDLQGDLHQDPLTQLIYSTDASVYQEKPIGTAFPRSKNDIIQIVKYAEKNNMPLIPRTAGTSLAGQCVGNGLVVDVSKYMTKILNLNQKKRYVTVQPGVIRDELNDYLKNYNLFFGPNTSTANRCMIGGMVGNNSSGTTSIKYGTTRDKIIEIKAILSDGSEVIFNKKTIGEVHHIANQDDLEGQIYRQIIDELSNENNQKNILSEFPDENIHRRNTGYAIDVLLKTELFGNGNQPFNFAKLLCGSEGTLAFFTEITIELDHLPPKEVAVIALHFESIHKSLQAVPFVMQYNNYACELMDKAILNCTKGHRKFEAYRFFLKGDPEAVLLIELRAENEKALQNTIQEFLNACQKEKIGYDHSILLGKDTTKAWDLRKAGLGLLANIPGDEQAVPCIEDTAVNINQLADYIQEFSEIMDDFGQKAIYYAHAGAGELHLRPLVNLKTKKGVEQFKAITTSVANLVKKYNGSMSGEHGDGRVRAEFIPLVLGKENYALFERIKNVWDPKNIFNPGKIVYSKPMEADLRFSIKEQKPIDTIFDFSNYGGVLKAAEKCNGSGDCRKLETAVGGMCPSYQATRNEKDTTRARANTLRQILTNNTKENPFDDEILKEALDLCLSCKACSFECPSNVDMTTLKAEFLYQYQKCNGISFRSRFFSEIVKVNKMGSIFPRLSNFVIKSKLLSYPIKKILKIAPQRSLPTFSKTPASKWAKKNIKPNNGKSVYIFLDEFTNHNEAHIGIKAIELLQNLDYNVKFIDHSESGRASLSKGLLDKAKQVAEENVELFFDLINDDTPLIGIEPSTILSFRDEYPKLVNQSLQQKARDLSKNCLTIEEFLSSEFLNGNISSNSFKKDTKHILLHGHCHQKSLTEMETITTCLSIPENFHVEVIPSGCCGMAGSFGYEQEHYDVSMQVGELVLFPAVRAAQKETIVVAPGTSCRHQIKDGTGRASFSVVEVLWLTLNSTLK